MAGESQQAQAIQGFGQIATAYGTAQTAAATMEGENTNLKKPFGETKVGEFLGGFKKRDKKGAFSGGLLGLLGKGLLGTNAGGGLFGLVKGIFGK